MNNKEEAMSNNEFTARTGRTVAIKSRSMTGTVLEISGLGTRTTVDLGDVETLREYFQHERDKELGRWRWTDQDSGIDYLVRELGYDSRFRVTNESTSETLDWTPEQYEGFIFKHMKPVKAILAYLETRPTPKPWHDAKPGEVWVLRVLDEPEERPYTVGVTGFNGEDIRGEHWNAVPIESHVFTKGRRIWPEIKEEQQ